MNKSFLIILIFSFFLASCSQFGENPSGDHLEKIKISPNYDIEKERFKNRNENIIIQMKEKVSFWNMTKDFCLIHQKLFQKLSCQKLSHPI